MRFSESAFRTIRSATFRLCKGAIRGPSCTILAQCFSLGRPFIQSKVSQSERRLSMRFCATEVGRGTELATLESRCASIQPTICTHFSSQPRGLIMASCALPGLSPAPSAPDNPRNVTSGSSAFCQPSPCATRTAPTQ